MMDKTSLIPGGLTVVMPLHNKGPHVARAINSVLDQTAGFDALIVVDDASSDDGADRVREFTDPRIMMLRREVPGPGGYAARNLAIQHAQTEWIAFLDADDEWLPEYLAAIGALIKQADATVGCVFTGHENRSSSSRSLDLYSQYAQEKGTHLLHFDEFIESWVSAGDCPIWTSAVAIRRATLIDADLFPADRCKRGGDKDLWLRAMWRADAICNPQPFAIYHRDSENMVTKNIHTARHCICETLAKMIADSDAGRAKRLKKLYNFEIYRYAKRCLKRGNLPVEAFEGFYKEENLLQWLLLSALSRIPSPLLRTAKSSLKSAPR